MTDTTSSMRNAYASLNALGLRSGSPDAALYVEGENRFDRWLTEQLAEAWDRGEATGWSRAMRHMSDEPSLGRQTENPYRPGES